MNVIRPHQMIVENCAHAGALRRAWARGLAPDARLTVSEWADRYRVFSGRASAEPGVTADQGGETFFIERTGQAGTPGKVRS